MGECGSRPYATATFLAPLVALSRSLEVEILTEMQVTYCISAERLSPGIIHADVGWTWMNNDDQMCLFDSIFEHLWGSLLRDSQLQITWSRQARGLLHLHLALHARSVAWTDAGCHINRSVTMKIKGFRTSFGGLPHDPLMSFSQLKP